MQVNKEILFKKNKKITLDYDLKSPHTQWFQNIINKFGKLGFKSPKKTSGEAKK